MNVESTRWVFEIKEIPPIVCAYGTSNEKQFETLLISMALYFIENANKFNGVPFRIHNIPKGDAKIMVSFSLIFKTIQDAKEYIEALKKII